MQGAEPLLVSFLPAGRQVIHFSLPSKKSGENRLGYNILQNISYKTLLGSGDIIQTMDKFDVLVLGGGPGGYVAAIRAAQLGAKVALIEKDKIGGTCLNRGCIPTKAIIACTNLFEKIKKADNFGIKAENPSIDYRQVIERKAKVVEKVTKGVEF